MMEQCTMSKQSLRLSPTKKELYLKKIKDVLFSKTMKGNCCRLCLESEGNLVALFQIKVSKVRDVFMKLIKATVGIQMTLDDVVNSVCWNCLADIVNFGRFKSICIGNNSTIQDILDDCKQPTDTANDFLPNSEINLVYNWLSQKRTVLATKGLVQSYSDVQGTLPIITNSNSKEACALKSPSSSKVTAESCTQTSIPVVRNCSIQTEQTDSISAIKTDVLVQTDPVPNVNKKLQCNLCCSLDNRSAHKTDQPDVTRSKINKYNGNNNNYRKKRTSDTIKNAKTSPDKNLPIGNQHSKAINDTCRMRESQETDNKCETQWSNKNYRKRKGDEQTLATPSSTNNGCIPQTTQAKETSLAVELTPKSRKLPSHKKFKAAKTLSFKENATTPQDTDAGERKETDGNTLDNSNELTSESCANTDADCSSHGALDKSPSLFHFLHVKKNKTDYLKICTYCDKTLYSAKEAELHKKSHMQCKMCRKKFRSFRQTHLHLANCEFTQTAYISLIKVDYRQENSDLRDDPEKT